MFTFIKKVIKTGAPTSSYPLEPIAVDKNFRGKPEHNPQQCIGCAACVNACPSNALTVETDLASGELACSSTSGAAFSAPAAKKCARRRRSSFRRSMNWRCGRKRISSSSPVLRCATAAYAIVLSLFRKRLITPLRCLSTTATAARSITAKALRPARTANVRSAWCRPTELN